MVEIDCFPGVAGPQSATPHTLKTEAYAVLVLRRKIGQYLVIDGPDGRITIRVMVPKRGRGGVDLVIRDDTENHQIYRAEVCPNFLEFPAYAF